MDAEDLELFERSLRYATESGTGADLDAALEELGWSEALTYETRPSVELLFTLQGDAAVTSSALDHVLAFALGQELDGATGVVLPTIGRWDAPGQVEGGRLHVRGLATAALAGRETALVVAADGDGHVAVRVPTSSLTVREIEGVDPRFGLLEISGEVDASDGTAVDWTAAVAQGQLAVGHELVGASRKMLALAREHALEREQFGQPIAKFQAIRHKLAEVLIAIETAAATLDAAWLDGRPQTAAMAKATAGRCARLAAKHCQQVLAGIGFTTEHDLHLYVRRVLVLDQLFGANKVLSKVLGDELLASGQLPPLLPL